MKSPVAPGDVVGGKYRVERVLGSGGMGVVLAARHLELDQPVALKFILPHALQGKGNVERFLREARAAVRLKSEHVARVYDVGRDGEDRPFMVLELLEGMDLAKLDKQKGPLPVADAVEYVLQACEALVEAHAAGIVHRDLKPQNLFVTRRLNGTPLVKVLDFGISKAVGPAAEGQMALTDSTAVIGSPLYMAPEQMRSARAAEIRSDVWALGVILYELLGGQIPFDGETVTEVCIRVVNEPPPPLLELRPGLDAKLVSIVMRCLEKDPEARFHNVAALAAALEPFSRSAKQGGPVRPWRSFEDTQDSQDGGSPHAGYADATGPSTAVTIESLPPDAILAARLEGGVASAGEPSEDERRARALAGSTKASSGTKGAAASAASDRPASLVSTDVSWGQSSTGSAEPPQKRSRSFATGLIAGAVASLAAAAVVAAFLLGRGGAGQASGAAISAGAAGAPAKVDEGASGAPASAATATAPSTHASPNVGESSKVDDAAKASAAAAAAAGESGGAVHGAHPIPPIASAAGPAGRLLGKNPRTGGARTVGAGANATNATGATNAAGAAGAPAAKPADPASDPVSPNGAPILR